MNICNMSSVKIAKPRRRRLTFPTRSIYNDGGGEKMLVKATREDLERYMDFAYAIALDPARSGYPLFSDGVSTREQFVHHVWTGYDSGDQEILLFIANGTVEGWIQFLHIETDRYLQTNGFLIRECAEQAMAEFREYARIHFAGCDLYWGFPKRNARAITYLQKMGCRLSEEAYHDIFIFDETTTPAEPAGLVKVTDRNFSEFQRIHRVDPDAYWTSDRIHSALSEWMIYMLHRDGIALGYICARDGDIFDLGYRSDAFDKDVYKALVSAILRDYKAAGRGHVIFFNDERSQSAALELGFSCVGEYALFVESL